MVSSIPSNRCETVWAVVTVWSRIVVRVDAIPDELEPTSEHNSTHRVILGSWASTRSKRISIRSIRSRCFTNWASRIWLPSAIFTSVECWEDIVAWSSSNCVRRVALSSAYRAADNFWTSRIDASVLTTPNISSLIARRREAILSSTIPSILRGSTRSAWRRRISSCNSSRSTRKFWISLSKSRRAASAWRAPCSRKPLIFTAVVSKSGVAGNSESNNSWKPPGWGGAVMV